MVSRVRLMATFFWPGVWVADDFDIVAEPSHAAAVEVVVGWERERTLLLAKGLAGTAVSLILAFVAAALEGKRVSTWSVTIALGVELVLLGWAGVLMFRVRALTDEFARVVSGSVSP